jgi:DNA-directed RNA polymerase specialized sigma24 family protein
MATLQSADDALVAVLRKLDGFRGDSRFTTWVYKFAVFTTSVTLRRRIWQGRELPLADSAWERNVSARRAARFTRPSTTPVASCARTSRTPAWRLSSARRRKTAARRDA